MVNTDKRKLYKTGFTLIEVMVAVAVLSIGLVGGLTVITSNLRNISAGENRIIAAGLAAEGIESTRNVRDTNWLQGAADWKLDIEGVNPSNETIKFFYGDGDHKKIPSSPLTFSACGEYCRVYIYTKTANPGIGRQFYSDDFVKPGYTKVETNFYRLIRLTEKTIDSVEAKSSVRWVFGTQTYEVSAIETLYNWK